MVRNHHCIHSCYLTSILVSLVIIFQLFLSDDTLSDADNLWQENNFITTEVGDEHDWLRRRDIESVSLSCPNCTFSSAPSVSRTTDNTTVHETLYRQLRQYIRQLNHDPVIQNVDKFDLQADSDASLVIVIQVLSCSFSEYLMQCLYNV